MTKQTTKTIRVQYLELLQAYMSLKDEIFEYSDEFFDAMGYDLDGYWEDYYSKEFCCIDELRSQVQAFEFILKGLSQINYTFS